MFKMLLANNHEIMKQIIQTKIVGIENKMAN